MNPKINRLKFSSQKDFDSLKKIKKKNMNQWRIEPKNKSIKSLDFDSQKKNKKLKNKNQPGIKPKQREVLYYSRATNIWKQNLNKNGLIIQQKNNMLNINNK